MEPATFRLVAQRRNQVGYHDASCVATQESLNMLRCLKVHYHVHKSPYRSLS
jgi:hypothetical protein